MKQLGEAGTYQIGRSTTVQWCRSDGNIWVAGASINTTNHAQPRTAQEYILINSALAGFQCIPLHCGAYFEPVPGATPLAPSTSVLKGADVMLQCAARWPLCALHILVASGFASKPKPWPPSAAPTCLARVRERVDRRVSRKKSIFFVPSKPGARESAVLFHMCPLTRWHLLTYDARSCTHTAHSSISPTLGIGK